MQVKELMSRKFITLSPEDKVDRAIYLFHYEKIHHLPVISEHGVLEGLVSRHDLNKVAGYPKYNLHETQDGRTLIVSARKIRHVMRRNPYTIAPDEKAYIAAKIMAKEKIGALPVVLNKVLVGIVTSTHVLQAFVQLSQSMESETTSIN